MAGLGTLATTQIITGGFSCQQCIGSPPGSPRVEGSPSTADCKAGIITTQFSLFCTVAPPPPPNTGLGGGGGHYPRDAWNKFNPGEIQNFYKPVDDPYLVPRDREEQFLRKYKHVQIHFKMGNFEVEKDYQVPENRAKAIVKVLDVINATRDRIMVTASGLKRVTTRITVAVKNFRLRRKS